MMSLEPQPTRGPSFHDLWATWTGLRRKYPQDINHMNRCTLAVVRRQVRTV